MMESGDHKVWKQKYDQALHHIDTGNIAEARKILTELSREAPYDEIRTSAASQLEQFKPDWLATAFFLGTLLVLVVIALVYVF
jgi:predicted Zn-dependent protease